MRGVARRMRDAGVGCVVVLDGERRPVGILTDRDVAVRCVADGRDPDATRVAEVMSSPAACVRRRPPMSSRATCSRLTDSPAEQEKTEGNRGVL